MMNASMEEGSFRGYWNGSASQFRIFHDTLILGEKNLANIKTIKVIMLLLELISGLEVNIHKIMLVGINVTDSCLKDAADVLNCGIGRTPFKYRGLPISDNPQRLSFWCPLLERNTHKAFKL
jgi:hypothetical protein